MKIAFVDHYDSFSFNLVDWLKNHNDFMEISHVFADDSDAMLELMGDPVPVVLSPGPKSPYETPATMELVEAVIGRVPVLGVCLGHQILGLWDGAVVRRSIAPRHGATRAIMVASDSKIIKQGPLQIQAAAYNSLTVDYQKNRGRMTPTGWCEAGEIQVMEWWPEDGYLAASVQFHPESFLSDDLSQLHTTWLGEVHRFYRQRPSF